MRFTLPLALLLLLALPFIVWVGRPHPRSRRRWREWLTLGVRLLIVLLLVLSLAGAQAVRAADELAVVFLVDASDSITPQQAEQAESFVRQSVAAMAPNDRAAVVVFGANALVERPLSSATELSSLTSVPQSLNTNLAEAIRLGLALFPAGTARRLVVLSDGAATVGDTAAAAQLAAASSVPLDFVYLTPPPAAAEVTLLSAETPTRVGAGETFRLDVTAESTVDTAAVLRVLAGGALAHEETVQLRPGSNNFTVRLTAADETFARYRVQLAPVADTFPQNNELAAFTEVVGAPRVLLVAPEETADDDLPADEAAALRQALAATGLQVDDATPLTLPADLTTLSNYGSIVLVDVNAKNLAPRKMALLQSYVRDLGGGLVAVGGPQSYGVGGYFQTPLEETLPVNMQITDDERFPSVSIALVLDRSGSMSQEEGGVAKIQLAAEGAARVVQLLNASDEISVIPVDTEPSNPIGPLSAAERERAIALIRQIGAGGGGIYVRTGLEAAAAALAQSDNEIKHVILLADGADAEEKEGVPELIAQLTADGVTVSTVSIGGGPDAAWLQQMAELGNGRFHLTDQAANLPQIFTQETSAIQRSYLIEERFFPTQTGPSPILAGLDATPPLFGYVGTSPKATAQVVLTTHQGDPLLATWQYGLGRAVAWTSDATGRWATEWVPWPGFATFWTQAVRWTISDTGAGAVETAVTFDDGAATLTVDARDEDGRLRNNLDLAANVVDPDGDVAELALQQVAPGRYEATFTPTAAGAYLIRVAGGGGTEAAVAQTAGWVLSYSPEYRSLPAEPQTLVALADLTGGRDLTGLAPDEAGAAVFAHDLPRQATTRPIWPWLTLLAVLLLPLDIAARRLVVTRADLRRAWAATLGRVLPRPATRPEPQRPEPVTRLFAAKERAQRPREEAAPPPPIQQPQAEAAAATDTAETEAAERPSAPAEAAPQGSLAARLLEKRRQQEQNQEK